MTAPPRRRRPAPRRRAAGSQPLVPPGRFDAPRMDDLRERLRFHTEDGSIRLGDVRMALVHLPALAGLRRELIDSLGVEAARGLLTRMGYTAGSQDAELVREVRPTSSDFDAFAVGPQLQSLEGTLQAELVRFDADPARGYFDGEAIWKNSAEVDCHLTTYGLSAEPVCWMQVGYASGYTSAFLGKPCLVREVECRATGAEHCRVVGRAVDEWGADLDDLRFLRPHAPPASPAPAAGGAAAAPQPCPPAAPAEDLVGASAGFHAALHRVRRVAPTRATVLFTGETGVGKEMFARRLHAASPRAAGPFVAVNCAAIPDALVESELFGVERGAFTGAVASRPGRFERADGGTLFLDELGTLNLAAQAKLLRALQAGEIERVGDVRVRTVDVRVVAATNEDLEAKVRDGSFRRDLFYRLNVFPIHLPPLRERRDDLPLLMQSLLDKYRRMHGRRIPGFTDRAVRALLDHDYPGNIRELENRIESAVILAEDDAPLDVFVLFPTGRPKERPALAVGGGGFLEPVAGGDAESIARAVVEQGLSLKELNVLVLKRALDEAGGNYTTAAKRIGVSRAHLAYRLKKGRW